MYIRCCKNFILGVWSCIFGTAIYAWNFFRRGAFSRHHVSM